MHEALAEALQRPLDPLDAAEVRADAEDHGGPFRPASIATRIAPIAAASPTKIASPIRKCPMFNSTSCGRAAIVRAVAWSSPWPAWHSIPNASASRRGEAKPREFVRGAVVLAVGEHVAPGAGVQLDHGCADRARGLHRLNRRLDEQRDANADLAKLGRGGAQMIVGRR